MSCREVVSMVKSDKSFNILKRQKRKDNFSSKKIKVFFSLIHLKVDEGLTYQVNFLILKTTQKKSKRIS